MDSAAHARKLEALLFAEGGAMTKKKLEKLLGCSAEDLAMASAALRARLTGAIALIETETEIGLAVASDAVDTVRAAQESELGSAIGDAGLEVLAIVLYRGAVTRAEIDYIRGVNTSSTVRNLLARGLLERAGNPADGREYLYRPTSELLAHLGVTRAQELPEYATILNELATCTPDQKPDHAAASDTPDDAPRA